MITNQKENAIQSFQITLQRSQNLELTLRFHQDANNAILINEKNKELQKKLTN